METLASYLPQQMPLTTLSARDKAAAHKAAQDFEAVFISEMIRPVFDQLNDEQNPITGGGGYEQQVYNSFMVDELGKSVAKRGGIGIAEMVEKELLKLQEISHAAK